MIRKLPGRSLSLHARVILGMVIVSLPLLFALLVGRTVLLPRLSETFHEAIAEVIQETQPIKQLQVLLLNAAMPVNDIIISGDPREVERFDKLSHEIDRMFRETAITAFKLPQERESILMAQRDWEEAKARGRAILARGGPRHDAATTRNMKAFDAKIDAAVQTLDYVHELARGELGDHLARADALERKMLVFAALMTGIGLILALVVGVLVARSILRPLALLEKGAAQIGAGDLAHRIPSGRNDELGRVAGAFNAMAAKLERARSELAELAIRDSLTQAYNRREFVRRIEDEARRCRRSRRPFSLLMVDIDHFKSINDTYGHPAGDEALKSIVALLHANARPTDFIARYGGEEFALILPETASASAIPVAERLREAVAAQPVAVTADKSIRLTASFGVATYLEETEEIEHLIARADEALYQAKNAGRNCVRRFTLA